MSAISTPAAATSMKASRIRREIAYCTTVDMRLSSNSIRCRAEGRRLTLGLRGGADYFPSSFRASLASGTQDLWSPVTTSHSFMSRPRPGSKRVPLPAATSALTRSSESLTTKCPFDDSIANIFPLTLSAPDPNPLPEAGGVTCRSSAKALTTKAYPASSEGVGGVRARARGFLLMLLPSPKRTYAPRCASGRETDSSSTSWPSSLPSVICTADGSTLTYLWITSSSSRRNSGRKSGLPRALRFCATMIRSRSLAKEAEAGALRNRDSKPMSAPENAREKALFGFRYETQWHRLTEQSGDGIFIGMRRVAVVVENDRQARVGRGQDIGRLGHDADHIETENLLDVVDAQHVAAGDPARVVARQ